MAIQKNSGDSNNLDIRKPCLEKTDMDARQESCSSALPSADRSVDIRVTSDSPCLLKSQCSSRSGRFAESASKTFVYQPHSYLSLDTSEPRYDPSSPTFNKTLCFYEQLNLSAPRKKVKPQYLSVRRSDSSSALSSDGETSSTPSKARSTSPLWSKSTSSLASRIKRTMHLNRSLEFLGHALSVCNLKAFRSDDKLDVTSPVGVRQRRNTETSICPEKWQQPDERQLHKTLSADVVLHNRFISDPVGPVANIKERNWFSWRKSSVGNQVSDSSQGSMLHSSESVANYQGSSSGSAFTDSPGFGVGSRPDCPVITFSCGLSRPESLTSEDSLVDQSVRVTRVYNGVVANVAKRINNEDFVPAGKLGDRRANDLTNAVPGDPPTTKRDSCSGFGRSSEEILNYVDARASIVKTQTPVLVVHSQLRSTVTFRGQCEENLSPACCVTLRCEAPAGREQCVHDEDGGKSLSYSFVVPASSAALGMANGEAVKEQRKMPPFQVQNCPSRHMEPCYKLILSGSLKLPVRAGMETCV